MPGILVILCNLIRDLSDQIPVHIQCAFTYMQDPDDLPFRKDEILTVVKKDEESWWTARNSEGAEGSIPVPYIELVSLQLLFLSSLFLVHSGLENE